MGMGGAHGFEAKVLKLLIEGETTTVETYDAGLIGIQIENMLHLFCKS